MSTPKPHFQLKDDDDDALALRLWEGDDAAKGEMLDRYGSALCAAITWQFRSLNSAEVEDVLAEAIARFWRWRMKYDPAEGPLRVILLRICRHVALEYIHGHRKWQKVRLRETELDHSVVERQGHTDVDEDELDQIEEANPKLISTFRECLDLLKPVERDIWQMRAESSGDRPYTAAEIGMELGKKYENGAAIPAATIRQHQKRSKDRLIIEMKKRGYDMKELGYSHA